MNSLDDLQNVPRNECSWDGCEKEPVANIEVRVRRKGRGGQHVASETRGFCEPHTVEQYKYMTKFQKPSSNGGRRRK